MGLNDQTPMIGGYGHPDPGHRLGIRGGAAGPAEQIGERQHPVASGAQTVAVGSLLAQNLRSRLQGQERRQGLWCPCRWSLHVLLKPCADRNDDEPDFFDPNRKWSDLLIHPEPSAERPPET